MILDSEFQFVAVPVILLVTIRVTSLLSMIVHFSIGRFIESFYNFLF